MSWWPSASIGFLLIVACEAAAQSSLPAPAAAPASRSDWNVSAGYASFAFRDIAVTSRPMDGSPTTLEGGGPALAGRYERSSRGRRHRFDVAFARASSFEYATALDRIDVPASDRASRLEASYDYRAYPARDVGFDGLDLGIGVQTGLSWRQMSRHYAPAIDHQRHERDASVAGVGAVRFGRWPRADVELAWTFGIAIARSGQEHTGGTGVEEDYWGGGWRSDLAIEGRLPLTRQTHLGVRYVVGRTWRMASHHTYSVGQGQLTVGVFYVR